MSELQKYIDIERLKDKNLEGFQEGDWIEIQEKLDGANISICYEQETDTIQAFSRRSKLTEENHMRGAWNWVQALDKGLIRDILGSKYILYGEWLVRHTIVYPQDKYNNIYFFDAWDIEKNQYLPQEEARQMVKQLGLKYVPIFYTGKFTTWEAVRAYIGRTELGGEAGEGIVVKNITRLNQLDSRYPFYTKLVTEKFAEKKAIHTISPKKLEKRVRLMELTESVVTEGRVMKLLHKMIDDGIIPEDWDEHTMALIAKNIGARVYEDCVKEEPDIVRQVGEDFGRMAHSAALKLIRRKLNH